MQPVRTAGIARSHSALGVRPGITDAAERLRGDGFVAAGLSIGAGMAEHVAARRRCGGALLMSGEALWARALPFCGTAAST